MTARPTIHYRIAVADPHAHRFEVTLTVPAPEPCQALSLPVWIPGSYLVREFSRHLGAVTARQGQREVLVTQTAKNRWEFEAPAAARWSSATRSTPSTPPCAPPSWTRSAASSTRPASACARTARTTCRIASSSSACPRAGRSPPRWPRSRTRRCSSRPPTTTNWPTIPSNSARSGAANSSPAACRTSSSCPARCRSSTASGCCATRRRSARRRSPSGTAARASRRCRATCSC